jgi:hypothetical protein
MRPASGRSISWCETAPTLARDGGRCFIQLVEGAEDGDHLHFFNGQDECLAGDSNNGILRVVRRPGEAANAFVERAEGLIRGIAPWVSIDKVEQPENVNVDF